MCTVLWAAPGITYIFVALINKEGMATPGYRKDGHMAGCLWIGEGWKREECTEIAMVREVSALLPRPVHGWVSVPVAVKGL